MSGLPRGEDGAPPPAIVLNGELKVGECYGDASCDAHEDEEYHQENAIQGVHLAPPHSGKDVVQLHRDGTRK